MKTFIITVALIAAGCSSAVAGPHDGGTPPDYDIGCAPECLTFSFVCIPGCVPGSSDGGSADGGTTDDASSSVDFGGDPPDLGVDPPDAGAADSGPTVHCRPGEVGHGSACYYETTWTGISVNPRDNCYSSGGMPVEWRSIDEQHLLQTYIPGPADTVGIGLYDSYPPRRDWRWLSDMSSASVDWATSPTFGDVAALTGAGATIVGTTPMYMFCVRGGP